MPVTLLTDFGTADYFVGAMKGAVLSVAASVAIVDITHDIPPQDVEAAAYTLRAAYETFPPGTIHLAVVDPGVGSRRRPIAVAGRHLFVGPDNGLFTHVYDHEPGARVYHVTDERYFRHPVSDTFHGRDVFAPVAGALAAGVPPSELGPEIDDPVRLATPRVERLSGGALLGSILHVDRFGNCVTTFTPDLLPEKALPAGFRLVVGRREVRSLLRHYAAAGNGEPFAIWGSTGFLEIAVNRGSAARRLHAARGDAVTLFL